MKQIITSIVAMLAVAAQAQTTNLWNGSVTIGNWDQWVEIPADKFAQAGIADQIVITIAEVSTEGYAQVQLDDGQWQSIPGAGNIALNTESTSATYTLTADMLETVQENGMLVRGAYYTVTSVDLIDVTTDNNYDNSVWIGNTVMPSDWSAWQVVPSSSFHAARVGDLLRMRVTDVKAGAQGRISSNHSGTEGWVDMPGTEIVQISGNYFQFTITQAILDELNNYEMIVSGCNYTLTAIDIIDPATIVPLTLEVPVTGDDWVWNEGETPSVQVNISNPTANATTANATIAVLTDKAEPVLSDAKSATIAANGSQTVAFELPIDKPGFYQCTISVNDELARSFNIGYAPTQIVSEPDAQSDFDTFWSDLLAALDEVDPQYTLTELPEHSSADRKVYLVEMKSVADGTGNDITVRGYYAEPTAEGTYPALIHYQGYDSDGTSDPWCMNGGDNPGWIELTFSTRGQWINNRPPYVNAYGDWFAYGFGNKDDYYYRGAYADAVRAIDFIASRTKTDTRNIFAEGSSQGGALTIAAAALDDRLQAIAPAIQFMGDFPDYFQVGQWPASVAIAQQEALGLSDEEMYASLSYFDTKNLAPRITCPVITTIGMQDNVCPPHTNIAPYNNLEQVAAADKQISFNAELMHTVPADWWNTYMAFFDKYMDNTSGIDQAAIANKTAICHHMLQERTLRLSQMASPTSIAVTTIDGATVERVTTTSGEATIELPCGGAYVVTVQSATGEQSFKVLTK